jgi:hypothetical protein
VRLQRSVRFPVPQQPSSSANVGPAPQGPPRISLQKARILSVEVGARRLEPIGSESYDFDNSGSSSTSEETIQLTNTTQFLMSFDVDNATTKGGNASVGLLHLISFEAELQNTLRKQYSMQATSTLSVQRTSRITIPANTHVRVTFNWKRVWQDGTIHIRPAGAPDVALPYSITVDLSFDKTTTDVNPKGGPTSRS